MELLFRPLIRDQSVTHAEATVDGDVRKCKAHLSIAVFDKQLSDEFSVQAPKRREIKQLRKNDLTLMYRGLAGALGE
jgi:hypothetical protein